MANPNGLILTPAPSSAGRGHRVRLTSLAAALALAISLSGAPGATETIDQTTGCRFQIPSDWQGYTAQWTGECRDKVAEGLGVLRMYDAGRFKTAFYGEMSRGKPVIGVIDVGGGYMAGRFTDGKLNETDDRNLTIRAFRVASDAAREASERFRRGGNEASARHYATVAERLANQLD